MSQFIPKKYKKHSKKFRQQGEYLGRTSWVRTQTRKSKTLSAVVINNLIEDGYTKEMIVQELGCSLYELNSFIFRNNLQNIIVFKNN